MEKYKMFKYAIQIVSRKKLRTFLTSLGVTISVILLSFIIFGMQGLDTALTNEFTSRFNPNEIMLSNQGFGPIGMGNVEETNEEEQEDTIMDDEFLEELEELDDVDFARGMLLLMNLEFEIGSYSPKFENAIISGWDTDKNDRMIGDFILGEESLTEDKVYISQLVVNRYDAEPDEFIGKKITLKPSTASIFGTKSKDLVDKEYEFEITGVYDPGIDRNDVILTTQDAKSILADLGGFDSEQEYIEYVGYDNVIVTVKDEDKVDEIVSYISDEYNISGLTADDLLEFLNTITVGLTFALLLFAIVSGVVASIGIINTMIMSIYEQTREIGIIKAVGASNSQVLLIFLIQSGIIGLIGGILGLAVVYLAMYLLDPYLVQILADNGFNLDTFFEFDIILTTITIVASVMVGVIAGIYPSMKAAKLDPVKALRFE